MSGGTLRPQRCYKRVVRTGVSDGHETRVNNVRVTSKGKGLEDSMSTLCRGKNVQRDKTRINEIINTHPRAIPAESGRHTNFG